MPAHASDFWDAVRTPGLREYRRNIAAARAALAERNFEIALTQAQEAQTRIADRAEPLVLRALALAGLARPADALEAIRAARQLDETAFDAADDGTAAAQLAAQQGEHELAASVLGRVVGRMAQHNERRRQLYVLYGDVLLSLGPDRLLDAITAYREGARTRDARALLGLSLAVRRSGDRAESLLLARDAIAGGSAEAVIAALPIPDTEKAARRALALEAASNADGAREAWTAAAQGGPWASQATAELAPPEPAQTPRNRPRPRAPRAQPQPAAQP